jgi:hypothetical protein
MLYRKKYIISIYDLNDQLITIFDDVGDFANFFNKTPNQAKHILSRLFLKKSKTFYHRKKKYTASFIRD